MQINSEQKNLLFTLAKKHLPGASLINKSNFESSGFLRRIIQYLNILLTQNEVEERKRKESEEKEASQQKKRPREAGEEREGKRRKLGEESTTEPSSMLALASAGLFFLFYNA